MSPEFKEAKLKFNEYINSLPINKSLKNILLEETFIDKSPDFYLAYPLIFCKPFNYFDNSTLSALCIAGFLYYKSILYLDQIIDDVRLNKFKKINYLIFNSICQEESLKLLTKLFDNNSIFWNIWNKRKEEYFISIEQNIQIKIFSFDDFVAFCDNKTSFGKIAIDAINILSDNRNADLYNRLLDSHKYFYTGFQILDDIEDFRLDYSNKQFNIAHFELEKNFNSNNLSYKDTEIETLTKYLYINGIATFLLEKCIYYLNLSIESLKEIDIPLWLKTVNKKLSEAKSKKQSIDTYLKTLQIKLEIRNSVKLDKSIDTEKILAMISVISDPVISNSLDYVIREWQTGFSEVQHIMFLDRAEGFASDYEYHVGDIFQRALIADILCEANYYLVNDTLIPIIKSEIEYLIKNRRNDEVGGWCYFPSVPEIAADIDDLGQIIQLFCKSDCIRNIELFCKTPLNVLLANNLKEDGSLETWIVPKSNRTKIQEVQAGFNNSKWGVGPDVEVVANFLYALYLYDRRQYNSIISKGISYVASQQTSDGSWQSRWYYGNYYGTYVCLRLLTKYKTSYEEVFKSLHYLLDTQHSDGGWGLDNESDPLSTSLCILCLCSISDIIQKDNAFHKAIEDASKYIYHSQLPDKTWKSTFFIKPKMSEPYKSKTITAAFITKAFIALNETLKSK